MATLRFDFTWRKLNDALNALADAVNQNTPKEGQGTHTEQTSDGTVVHASQNPPAGGSGAGGDGGGGGGGPSGGQWMTITVYDDNCNPTTIQVWAQ